MDLRKIARNLRDHPRINPVVRSPFELLKGAGVKIPRRIYQHLGHSGVFWVPTLEGRGFTLRSYGHVIENSIYWAGLDGYEPESLRPWLQLAVNAKVVLDVGANIGLFALLAASVAPDAQIHAFEPLHSNAELLRANCALNPDFKIELHEAAVGDKPGTAELFLPGGTHPLSASLNREFRQAWDSSQTVPVVTIDDVVKSKGLSTVDLIKLDVEGHEEAALEGMKETLRRFRPALMIEVLPKSTPRLLEQLGELVKDGYAFYDLGDDGLTRLERVEKPNKGRNALLCPPEKLPASLRPGASTKKKARPLATWLNSARA